MRPTAGEIRVAEEIVHFHTPANATEAGIATVYQDLALALDLNTVENMFLKSLFSNMNVFVSFKKSSSIRTKIFKFTYHFFPFTL